MLKLHFDKMLQASDDERIGIHELKLQEIGDNFKSQTAECWMKIWT
jgi:hypothetical protein